MELDSNDAITEIQRLRNEGNSLQDQIYIVAGALGGICFVLVVAILILVIVAIRLNKKIRDAEESRRITEEIHARKFSAYTGEEVHRRLHTANPVAGTGGPNSEYAFNYPVSEYKLN